MAVSPYRSFLPRVYTSILREKTWYFWGKSTIDKLIFEHIKKGYEQYYIVYNMKEVAYELFERTPFWSSRHQVYCADTKESLLSKQLRKGKNVINEVIKYITKRRLSIFSRTNYEPLALWYLLGLRSDFSRFGAKRLAAILERNIFYYGVEKTDRLPPNVRRGELFVLHLHIGDKHEPPSDVDLASAVINPKYVGAYSRDTNSTRIFGYHMGDYWDCGDIPNHASIQQRISRYLSRPKVELQLNSKLRFHVTSEFPLDSISIFTVKDGTAEIFDHLSVNNLLDMNSTRWRYRYLENGIEATTEIDGDYDGYIAYALNKDYLGGIDSEKG